MLASCESALAPLIVKRIFQLNFKIYCLVTSNQNSGQSRQFSNTGATTARSFHGAKTPILSIGLLQVSCA